MATEQETAARGSVHIYPVSTQPVREFNPDAGIGCLFGNTLEYVIDDLEMFSTASGVTDKKQIRAPLLYHDGESVNT